MNDLTKQWLAFAQDDLRVADLILAEGIYTQVCFHSQQCVAKAFKSVFVHTGRTVVRTHSIVTLFQLLPADLTIQIQDDVSIFDDLYIPVRYPDTIPGNSTSNLPEKSDAVEAIALARFILQIVQQYVSK